MIAIPEVRRSLHDQTRNVYESDSALINSDLIKVMLDTRRSGKSVVQELIQEELLKSGVRRGCEVSPDRQGL